MTTYGQVAYEGYRGYSGGKSLVSGQPIPEWSALPTEIRCAWDCAGIAVLSFLSAQQTTPVSIDQTIMPNK